MANWMLPFADSHLGTKFGVVDKDHPNGHRGDDWNGLKAGTKLPAVATGTIVLIQESSMLGNVVVLKVTRKLKPPVYFGYCHMQKPCKYPLGAKIEIGETIGYLGNTGTASTGAHLHMTLGLTKTSVFSGKVQSAWAFLTKMILSEKNGK